MCGGGGNFTCIACLNERDDWIHTLVDLVKPHLAAVMRGAVPELGLKQQAQRARALGANN